MEISDQGRNLVWPSQSCLPSGVPYYSLFSLWQYRVSLILIKIKRWLWDTWESQDKRPRQYWQGLNTLSQRKGCISCSANQSLTVKMIARTQTVDFLSWSKRTQKTWKLKRRSKMTKIKFTMTMRKIKSYTTHQIMMIASRVMLTLLLVKAQMKKFSKMVMETAR